MSCDLAEHHSSAPPPNIHSSPFFPIWANFPNPFVFTTIRFPSLQPLCFDNHLDCLCLEMPNPCPAYSNLRTYRPRRGFQSLQISRPYLSSVRINGLKESLWL